MPMPDAADRRILEALQFDGRLTNVQLAERVAMSTSPCWRRVRQLESSGIIKGYRAELDRRKLGLGVLALVSVQIDSHGDADARRFEDEVAGLPEVIACYSVSGQADFLLQVVSQDLDTYADFAMTVIRRLPGIKAMHTSFVLKEIKAPGPLPIPDQPPTALRRA